MTKKFFIFVVACLLAINLFQSCENDKRKNEANASLNLGETMQSFPISLTS